MAINFHRHSLLFCCLSVPKTVRYSQQDPSFAFFRFVWGSGGMKAFKQEDWMYSNNFVRKGGIRQAECYFTSYDPLRETFCLILEDLNR